MSAIALTAKAIAAPAGTLITSWVWNVAMMLCPFTPTDPFFAKAPSQTTALMSRAFTRLSFGRVMVAVNRPFLPGLSVAGSIALRIEEEEKVDVSGTS